MKRNLSLFSRALVVALLVTCIYSCKKNDIKKIEIDNQFALSLFSDTVKIGDLLNGIDSTVSQFVKINESGNISVYYSDSIENVVVAKDILEELDDVNFESSSEFELPTIPSSPVEIPLDLPFDDLFAIPFEYDGYEITSVVLKSGMINLNINTDLDIIEELTLSTDEIIMSDGSDLELSLSLSNGEESSLEIDLTNCIIAPDDANVKFSVMIKATVPANQSFGGIYNFDIDGSISDIEFKSIDGSIADSRFDFAGTHDFNINFPNLFGDLKITTPEFSIKYVNSFGFDAQGSIDSLFLTDDNGVNTTLIKDWNEVDILLHSTGDDYGLITDLDEELIEEINLLQDYRNITFAGNIIMGCDNMAGNMIDDDSHIDIIADLALPLEFNIDNLTYIDTLDFNLNLSSEENADSESIHVEDIFDELEFKFVFENGLPIEIRPQLYVIQEGEIIDKLFDDDVCVHGNFDGEMIEDIIVVKVVDEKLYNIQLADQLLLNIGFSSHGEDVVINANDYFNLRIGLKTKTTEIYTEDLNF